KITLRDCCCLCTWGAILLQAAARRKQFYAKHFQTQLRIITIRIHNLLTRVEPMRNLISQHFLLSFALFSAFFAHAAYADNSCTVEGKFGIVTFTGEPQRVVTLYAWALDASYVVGAKPLGSVLTRGADGVASYFQDKALGITFVGISQE